MAKNLILENWCEIDIPRELQRVLKDKFTENREIWTQFQTAFYPENREETKRRFAELETGDNIVCQTVFDGFMQLELMASLLMLSQIKPGLNIWIYHYSLQEEIERYFGKLESELTPNSDEFNDSPEKRKEFKKNMNFLVEQALKKHNVYQLSKYEDEIVKITL